MLIADHPRYVGPIGVTGCDHANGSPREADVVLCVGTRLQDFTTGSWTVFGNDDLTLIGLNAARFDATKHLRAAAGRDALTGLSELAEAARGLAGGRQPGSQRARRRRQPSRRSSRKRLLRTTSTPTYAQVIGAVNRLARDGDYALTAAGGFPGELTSTGCSKGVATFDCEYGYSCMGYEIAGAWGAKMARPTAT